LVRGKTTIERRGATRGFEIDVAAAVAVGEDLVAGQNHQAMQAMTSAANALAASAATAVRRRRGAAIGTPDTGRSATASGRNQ
jgi:hypothetical protein